jgi:hypothetical protein
MLRNTPPMHCFPAFFRPSLLRRPEFETLDDARSRLRQQFKKESNELLEIATPTEKAWIDSILAPAGWWSPRGVCERRDPNMR